MTYLKFLVNCPDQWESEGVKQLLNAYQAFPCKLHLANLSSAAAINKVLKLKKKYPDLTCETCPQYLCFTDATVPPKDTRYKSFPPIRNLNNNTLLWELLKVKAIDSIASNHTSVRPDLKFLTDGDFRRAATGFSSLGFTMQAVWGKIRTQTGDIDTLEHYLVRLSKWLSLAPSKLVGIDQLRGSICKDKIADLIIWSPYESVVSEVSHSVFGDTSPFSGMELSGRIERVYVRGRIAFNLGEFKAVGRRLQRTYS
jgi:allantoinase